MDIERIEEAVERGVPFSITVGDGEQVEVHHPDYIFLPPKHARKRTYVMVHNDRGFASILPLPSITRLDFGRDAEPTSA